VFRLRDKLISRQKVKSARHFTVIGDRRLALLGHARSLPEGAPAHDALQVSVELLAAPHQSLIGGESQEDHEAAGCVVFSDLEPTARNVSERQYTGESKRAKFRTAHFFRFVMLQIESNNVLLSQSMHSTTTTYAVAARNPYSLNEQVLLTAFVHDNYGKFSIVICSALH